MGRRQHRESGQPNGPAPNRLILGAVFLAAVAMGMPSLKGGFLSEDDIYLVRDNVLVNHPSLAHALELFRIVHKDLYQPIPLLMFSAEFFLLEMFGSATPEAVARLCHIDNVLLHGLNAVLVYLLLSRVVGRRFVAAASAFIFAVHPLSVEPVAWLNGRMTLMSTTFALMALLGMEAWEAKRGWGRAAGVLAASALCMMSKVAVALPALMFAPLLLQRRRPTRKWWALWSIVAALTLGFTWINYQASSSTIASGGTYLEGPRLARTLWALGWYGSRAVVPIGLSPIHPAVREISWADRQVIGGGVLVIAVAAVTVASARRTRAGWVGILWFLAAVGVTLPLIPSRNLSVAERYVYLANVGIFALLGAFVTTMTVRRRRPVLGVIVLTAGCGALLATSWRTCGYYHDDVAHTARALAVYPHVPGLGVRHGWALYWSSPPRYAEAAAAARAHLDRYGDVEASDANQLLGMALHKLGDTEGGMTALHRAAEAAPSDGLPLSRLASVLMDSGRLEDAVEAFEACLRLSPSFNPALVQLARLYERLNRPQDAKVAYDKALANNPYEIGAIEGLAGIEIAEGKYRKAIERLTDLLEWMPENVTARSNRAVCQAQLGDTAAALGDYMQALRQDSGAAIAALNAARLLMASGDPATAYGVLARYLEVQPADATALRLAVRAAAATGQVDAASQMIARAVRLQPKNAAFYRERAWAACMAGRWEDSATAAGQTLELSPGDCVARGAQLVSGLAVGSGPAAAETAEQLAADGCFSDADIFDDIMALMERYSVENANDSWPYYVAAVACKSIGRDEAAQQGAAAFKEKNNDAVWHQRIDEILKNEPK